MVLKSVTFSAPETALETTYILCYFSKPWLKFGEKAGDHVCFDGIDQFNTHFFVHSTSFVIGKNYV